MDKRRNAMYTTRCSSSIHYFCKTRPCTHTRTRICSLEETQNSLGTFDSRRSLCFLRKSWLRTDTLPSNHIFGSMHIRPRKSRHCTRMPPACYPRVTWRLHDKESNSWTCLDCTFLGRMQCKRVARRCRFQARIQSKRSRLAIRCRCLARI